MAQSSRDGSSSEEEEELNGTEHYIDVGYAKSLTAVAISSVLTGHCRKSKLRKHPDVVLGPKYAGSRISRQALQDEDEHKSSSDYEDARESHEPEEFADPDDVDMNVVEEDGEINSDDAFGESDSEKFQGFTFRGSNKPRNATESRRQRNLAVDFMTDSEEENGSSNEEDEVQELEERQELDMESSVSEEDDEDGQPDSDQSEDLQNGDGDSDDNIDGEGSNLGKSDAADDDEQARRAELRKIMNEEQKTVVATISQAVKADAEKGVAVKQQRKTFDAFLNVRIRLQKSLVAINSIAAVDKDEAQSLDVKEPYRAAEEAAIKLLDTLTALRFDLNKSSSIKSAVKRKRFEIDTPSTDIWKSIQSIESEAVKMRLATLEKWSAKVRSTSSIPIAQKFTTTAPPSITSTIQSHLSDSTRLIARTRVPRSCAPVQASRKVTSDENIFDDADFYQTLLKELVEQRMADSSAVGVDAVQGMPQWAAVKESKTRKKVDTKASKGRRMKYTVHEKLQNFMAPEDRNLWEPEAVDRFFGTLLGRRMDLGEEDETDDVNNPPLEEEALMLFRS